jgi:hypothetical protein
MTTTETETPTIPEWKPCSQCGTVYHLWDAHGNPLPRPQRPRGRPVLRPGSSSQGDTLPFAFIRAKRYRGGIRLRDICDRCHAENEAERARAKRQREHAARETTTEE